MKLKYYLRGLGIGIAVTAVVMGVSVNAETGAVTDEQVIERAKELGMVDGVLAQFSETDTQDAGTAGTEDGGTEAETTSGAGGTGSGETEAEADADSAGNDETEADADSGSEENGKTEADAGADSAGNGKTEADAGADSAGNGETEADAGADSAGNGKTEADAEKQQVETVRTVVVAIYPGEGSYTVSRKLASLGLVESADVYDNFLCQNGYDKKLCTGNYEIKVGAAADEIAKILTRSQ